MEAMACGAPTVAYAVGGTREVTGEYGQAGCLVRPDDPTHLAQALLELLADPSGAYSVAARGLERARSLFTADQAADAYERLLLAL
jgi:glycosyltransferase involved in cell wall biosynthesis